jgi:hypothetical protein
MTDPYRKQAERPPVPKELRRWYTKAGEVHKGPFDATSIRRSYKEGYLRSTSLVRAEDEAEWRPLQTVKELTVGALPLPPGRPAPIVAPTPEVYGTAAVGEGGTFWGGFAAGVLAGLLAVIVVYVTKTEPETRRGAVRGFLARFVFSVLVVALTVATDH